MADSFATPRILLTGFEPFGGDDHNPSWAVAHSLQGARVGSARIEARRLPCAFGAAHSAMNRALAELRPQLVLALGLASGRSGLSLERVAINVDDARIPDNASAQPVDQPVVPGGPAAYFTTLPIKAMVAALQRRGLPASVSQTAGTFVCNHVFYGLMHALAGQPDVRAGFMHIPLTPDMAANKGLGQPSLSESTMREGVKLSLETAWLHTGPDLRVGGGAEN